MAPTFDENIKLAYAQAHKLAGKLGLYSIDELENAALLGLSKAVERFDPSLKKAFSSFAVPYIRGEMLRYLRSISPVPRRLQELYAVGKKLKGTDEEVAAILEVTPRQWKSLKQLSSYFFRTVLDAKYYQLLEECSQIRSRREGRWLLTTPNGQEFEICNLSGFCRLYNNRQDDPKKHLCAKTLGLVALGSRHTHKGWRCKKLETHTMDMNKAV